MLNSIKYLYHRRKHMRNWTWIGVALCRRVHFAQLFDAICIHFSHTVIKRIIEIWIYTRNATFNEPQRLMEVSMCAITRTRRRICWSQHKLNAIWDALHILFSCILLSLKQNSVVLQLLAVLIFLGHIFFLDLPCASTRHGQISMDTQRFRFWLLLAEFGYHNLNFVETHW